MSILGEGPVTDDERYAALLREIRAEFPRFRLVKKKDSRWQRAIDLGLRLLTFGKMASYLTDYQTTIGRSVYVTSDWDSRPAAQRYVTLRHERIHLRQFRRFTLLGMSVLYLAVPLPLGLAYFRARFEKEAYAETVAAAVEVYGRNKVDSSPFREHIISQFLGPSYGWMWPFRGNLERWYDRAVAAAVAERGPPN